MRPTTIAAITPGLLLIACIIVGHLDRCPARSKRYGRCALARGHRPAKGRPEGWHVNRTGTGWTVVKVRRPDLLDGF